MARKGPKMRMRFRKTYTLIPGLLQWTLTKKGASLNFRLGPLSKSWGTGGRKRTTIDAPGEMGFQWQKVHRKNGTDTGTKGRGWLWATLAVVAVQALVLLCRYGLAFIADAGETCTADGNLLIRLAVLLGVELTAVWLLWTQVRMRAGLFALTAIAGSVAVWHFYGVFIGSNITCV